MSLKVGQRVEISGKDCQGVIAYIGHPSFAAGKWIGVILDEPKGRNNGTIKGQFYFKCTENHGMFVRQTQLILIDESGNRTEPASPSSAAASGPTTPDEAGASRARSRLTSAAVRQRNQPTASRMSLAGSRTQLAAPSTENLTALGSSGHERKDGGESHIPAPTSTKRASFVEKTPSTSSPPGKKPKAPGDHDNTGFVETLKPQFVPGQAMGPSTQSSTMEEKLTHLQLAQENENLKAQIRDLSERIEILRVKRMQDKERMKDFEKLKLQLEQLIEFKTKVMESQASLQRELQRARQEARDAHAAREQYQDEMADLAETVEMATLDKEMAEEKAETLQIELEQLKEKLEEQTIDLEILRNEMSDKMSGGSAPTGTSSFEVKQLEQQNARLRETLVRMRDLSAHEKHEFQKLQKDLEQKKSEILELSRTKEKLSARVEEMERQIADLQEQVDAALGAEEMVENLGERKMALEEKVAELEEAVTDLEALQDMSDQLAESSKELEMELREELDMALAAARDAQRQRDAALETLSDREMTITKFRELTQKLQEQCLELQQRLQSSESTNAAAKGAGQQLAEILDFQKTFAETRAQTKAVDLELRRLDAEEARNHVRYLLSFMPLAFMNRGGDHDAILTLLFIPRMIQKTEIVISQVRDKYKSVDKIDRATIVKGHAVAQSAFRSRLCAHMYALQTALGSFESALSVCSSDSMLKVGGAYPEMAAQEKSVDSLIDLAKRDQLDENLSMEAIERCCAYFCTIYGIYFGEEDVTNQARLVVNGTRCLGSACEVLTTEAATIKNLIDGEQGDMGLLCQHIETVCEAVQNNLKSARRRVPREFLTAVSPNEANLGLDKDWYEQITTCYQHATKLMRTLQDLTKTALQTILTSGDLDTGLVSAKLKEMAANSTEKIYDADDIGAIATIKASLAVIQKAAVNLAEKMAECENELAMSGITHRKQENLEENSPIFLRAQATRKELEETKVLSRKLEARDSDIREAKLALREKQEELSEMILRKELAEKRLATQQHEHELTIEKLKRNLEEVQTQLRRKEKEFEETMDHLQTDIDSLESEKGQLKEKLKSIGKKGGVPSTPGADGAVSIISTGSSIPVGPPMQEGALHEKIQALRDALKDEARQKRALLNENLQKKLDSLPPLPKFDAKPEEDPKIKELLQKKNELMREAKKLTFFPVVPDLTGKKLLLATEQPVLEKALPVYKLLEREQRLRTLKERVDELSSQVREETIKRTYGAQAPAQFAVFPARHIAAAMRGLAEPVTAEILIPHKGPSQVINIPVGTQELRNVHMLLSY
ncbi:dynactin subunit 1 isoform X4 [Nasonia vitripennis]|uniref:Dynactin subunit 1 n=1 Tax=Nasonia vitripennis TaxID=7425 RepID=A0A7M7QZY6_NASVI|nr:dynactin subunit 1 isoform X4 [Nasonia vitripennis]XP_032456360.1 dynactin subunit 1 isoform X4 [Nasonia vitripennis]